jgi:hypothetical protein
LLLLSLGGLTEDDSLYALRTELESVMRRFDSNMDPDSFKQKQHVHGETVFTLTTALETYHNQQLHFFQELLDNTSKLLDDYRLQEDSARTDFQREVLESLNKLCARLDQAEANLSKLKADD